MVCDGEGVIMKRPGRKGDASKALKISALREAFQDEWVAAEVTKVDKFDVPLAGILISHSADKSHVYETAKAYLVEHPAAELFIFFAGDTIPEGIGVMLALR